MNRISACMIAASILGSLFLLPLSSGAVSSSAVISTGGVVQYNILPRSQTPIKKLVYGFGMRLSDADTTFIAQHFDLLEIGGAWEEPLSNLQSIKTKNPNVKILGYKNLIGMHTYYEDWAEVNNHEDWFIHDTAGNRVVNSIWGWYLMDVGSAGWRQHYVSYVNNKINNAQYDGCLADDVHNVLNNRWWSTMPSTIKSSDVQRWHDDTLGMLQYVKANLLPGKILVINTDELDTGDYRNAVDGICYEHAIHAYIEDPNNQGSWNWKPWLDILSQDSATGKTVLVVSGTTTPTGTSQADVDRVLKFCYSAFLCALNGPNMYFSFHTELDSAWKSSDGSKGYYAIMDTDIGAATGAYYFSQNVYMRDFSRGKVLLNPSSTAYNLNLGSSYRLLDGTVVSSIVLGPWSGEILLS